MKNTGLILKEQTSDYFAGSAAGFTHKRRVADWAPYLPDFERQLKNRADVAACTTFSILNTLEAQLNYDLSQGQFAPQTLSFFKDNGYIKNGKINFSDRFTAKMSGTTHQGNYHQKVLDSIRKDGLLPEDDLPFEDNMTWDEYYAEIPQDLKDKAKKILDFIQVEYNWVLYNYQSPMSLMASGIKDHLLQTPLCGALPLCNWNSDTIPACSGLATHAVAVIKEGTTILDSYSPFIKELGINYQIPWMMKAVVTLKDKPNVVVNIDSNHVVKKSWNFDISEFIIEGNIDIPQHVANKLTQYHIPDLQRARDEFGKAIIISGKSGYRSKVYELKMKRNGTSEHTFSGLGAVDITCRNKSELPKLLDILKRKTSYTRIAYYGGFIHCDYKDLNGERHVYKVVNGQWVLDYKFST